MFTTRYSTCPDGTLLTIKMRSCGHGGCAKVSFKERLRNLEIVERVILPKGNGLQALGFHDTMINRYFVEYIVQHLSNKKYLDCQECKQLYGRAFCRRMRRLVRLEYFENFFENLLDQFSHVCADCYELYYIVWIEEQSHIVICLVSKDFEDSDLQDSDTTINASPLTMLQNYVCQKNCLVLFCDKVKQLWNCDFR